MASATGIPNDPVEDREYADTGDSEPLLGRPGDASQRENAPIVKNLILGMYSIPFLSPLSKYSWRISRVFWHL